MNKFKVGDNMAKFVVGQRVRFYYTDNCRAYSDAGTVVEIVVQLLRIKIDRADQTYLAHPKQCRKLVKKKRRRVWVKRGAAINEAPQLFPGTHIVSLVRDMDGDYHSIKNTKDNWTEYAEVKKK